MKKIIAILSLSVSSLVFSQDLSVKGESVFQQEKKLKNKEVQELLQSNTEALNLYKESRTKSTVGGFLLGFGIGLTVSDLVVGATADVKYPTAATYIGLVSTLISIPVLSGRSKKLKRSIELYNEKAKMVGNNDLYELRFTTNSNGAGLRLQF